MTKLLSETAVLRLLITLLIVGLMASAAMIGVLTNKLRSAPKTPWSATPESDLNSCGDAVQSVRLSMNGAATVASDNTVTKQIRATVLPESAKNKAVDWTIEWVEPSDLDISEYVTVTPESDGSAVAAVTCHRAFEGEALITATSREGRVFDTCRVVFVGIPSSLQANCANLNEKTGAFGTYYEIGSGNTYDFDLSAENVFGVVGTECAYSYTVSAVGSIRVQNQYYDTLNDGIIWVEGTESTVNIADITAVSKFDPTIFDCNLQGNRLSVTVHCTLENYFTGSVRKGNVITYENKFRSYSDDNWYYEIRITETNSGVGQTIKLRPVVSVTNLNLDSDIITF